MSHGVGLVGAVAATPVLIVAALRRGDVGDVVGSAVFAGAMILLYLASTAYHAAPRGRARDWLRRLDHAAIYVLIAGTYTPFTLGPLAGGWGWTLFGMVWAAAAVGIVVKLTAGVGRGRLSTALYLGMGWLVLIAVRPLTESVHPVGLAWLVAGGVCYTAGVAFYVSRRMAWGHFVWHLFVLAGSTCHFFAVLGHAA